MKSTVAVLLGLLMLTPLAADALTADEVFLTSTTRGVVSRDRLPEALEWLYFMHEHQNPGVRHDSQVPADEAIGQATRIRNPRTEAFALCDIGSCVQSTHHWSPLTRESEAVTTDRDRLLGLVYSNRVKVVLSGHIHDNLYVSTPNPVLAGRSVPPWPKPESLADGAMLAARLADPASTVFLTSTTVSAFLLGNSRYNGFLYAWVRDGRIAWMDTVPLSLSVAVEHGAGASHKIHIRNGPEKALKGFPLKLDIGPGRMMVSSSGRDLPVVEAGTGGGSRWVQVDIPAGGEITIDVCPLPHP